MHVKSSFSRKCFMIFNCLILGIVSLVCFLPFVNLFAVSLSSGSAAAAGKVNFVPVEFTLSAYLYVMKSEAFIRSFFIALQRVLLGGAVNMLLIILTAYPLSKEKSMFRHRGVYAWFFIFTILFSGGLIPWYMTIKYTGIMNTIWALILPGALPVFSMIVMLNFFRGLPREIEEAAFIDGAGHWKTLWKIVVPLSKPSLATVGLFSIVSHWNSWFDGLILMNKPRNYPLQSYLQTVIINPESFFKSMANNPSVSSILQYVNNRTAKTAQLFIATLPVLIIYPFLQKYFTTGLVMGSVKG